MDATSMNRINNAFAMAATGRYFTVNYGINVGCFQVLHKDVRRGRDGNTVLYLCDEHTGEQFVLDKRVFILNYDADIQVYCHRFRQVKENAVHYSAIPGAVAREQPATLRPTQAVPYNPPASVQKVVSVPVVTSQPSQPALVKVVEKPAQEASFTAMGESIESKMRDILAQFNAGNDEAAIDALLN